KEDDASKEDELKEEEEEDTIYYKDLITGNVIEGPPSCHRDTRDVAIVTVTKSDNIEFTKLIQVAIEGPSDTGPLLDLHVSLFGDTAFEVDNNNAHQEEFQDTIQSIEKSLSRLDSFKTESQVFLRDHMDTMDSLNLHNTLPRNLSNAQSMYASNTEYKSRDPFDQRQKEIVSLVNSLKKELHKFKSSLVKSEDLVNDVQIDMNDTRNRMET
ncbi:hypothetical protein BDF21DRAFT_324793, partial [Thamnidium elegans]